MVQENNKDFGGELNMNGFFMTMALLLQAISIFMIILYMSPMQSAITLFSLGVYMLIMSYEYEE